MVNQHVKILNNTNLDYRYMTNNRTGWIVHKSSQGVYTIKMDHNPDILIKARDDQFIVIPDNVYTEWFLSYKPNIIALNKHTKAYMILYCNNFNYIMKPLYYSEIIEKLSIVANGNLHDDNTFRINNKDGKAIYKVAELIPHHSILWLSDNQYSLRDIKC